MASNFSPWHDQTINLQKVLSWVGMAASTYLTFIPVFGPSVAPEIGVAFDAGPLQAITESTQAITQAGYQTLLVGNSKSV
jgi:hypothetical protein